MTTSNLLQLVKNSESPKRMAISRRFPPLKKPAIFVRRIVKRAQNNIQFKIARKKSPIFFSHVIARHQSVLIRKLGESDQELQRSKVTNLKRACQDLNGLIIEPHQIFSLWETIGNPTKQKGYVDGMLLSNGRVIKGIGGGLCQLSNFLCWIFLHANVEIVERSHHSMDVFPDSGRILPFGSGATCLFNFIDFKIRNVGNQPLQLKIWVTDTHLKGQLVSPQQSPIKFSIKEKNHTFVKRNVAYYRYNEIQRMAKINGREIWTKNIFTNFAPVLYTVDDAYLQKHGYNLVDLTGKE